MKTKHNALSDDLLRRIQLRLSFGLFPIFKTVQYTGHFAHLQCKRFFGQQFAAGYSYSPNPMEGLYPVLRDKEVSTITA